MGKGAICFSGIISSISRDRTAFTKYLSYQSPFYGWNEICNSGKFPLGKCSFGQMSFKELSIAELPFGELSIGELSVGETSSGKCPSQ